MSYSGHVFELFQQVKNEPKYNHEISINEAYLLRVSVSNLDKHLCARALVLAKLLYPYL